MQSQTLKQLVRYGIVGFSSNAAGYVIYLGLTTFLLPPKLSMTLLYAIATTISYLGNRRYTFGHEGNSIRTIIFYFIVYFLGWLLNFCLLAFFSDHLGYPHQLVQAFAIFVVAAFLFISLRQFVFSPNRKW